MIIMMQMLKSEGLSNHAIIKHAHIIYNLKDMT